MASARNRGRSQRQFGARLLIMFKGGWVQESFAVERQNAERGPYNPDRLTIHQLDRDVGHAHALPGKPREAMAFRVSEHSIEGRAVQSVVPIEQEPTE